MKIKRFPIFLFFGFVLIILVAFFFFKIKYTSFYGFKNYESYFFSIIDEKRKKIIITGLLYIDFTKNQMKLIGFPTRFSYRNFSYNDVLKAWQDSNYRVGLKKAFYSAFGFSYDNYIFISTKQFEKLTDFLGCFRILLLEEMNLAGDLWLPKEHILCGDKVISYIDRDYSNLKYYRGFDSFLSLFLNYRSAEFSPLRNQKFFKDWFLRIHTDMKYEKAWLFLNKMFAMRFAGYTILPGEENQDKIILDKPLLRIENFLFSLKEDKKEFVDIQLLNGTNIYGLAKKYRKLILGINKWIKKQGGKKRFRVIEFGNTKYKMFKHSYIVIRRFPFVYLGYLSKRLDIKRVYTLLDFYAYYDYTVILGYDRKRKDYR